MSDQPVVTVVTPIYNTGKYVVKALECLKRQTFQNFEHILIDDCSTDDSVAIVEEWIRQNNHKCTFLKNEQNRGVCVTINRGKRLAKGKYINGLGDDEWDDDYLERRVKHFEQLDENIGVTVSDAKLIDENSNLIAPSWYEKRGSSYETVINALSYPEIMYFNYIIAPSAMVRKSVFEDVGYHDETLTVEDYDMWFRILQKYKIVHFDDILLSYRRRMSSLSKAPVYKARFIIDWLVVYEKNLDAMWHMRKSIKRAWRRHAIDNFCRNKDTRLKWFVISYKLNKDITSLIYLTMCALKVSPDFVNKVKDGMRSKKADA